MIEDATGKIWSIAVIVFSSLISFFMYRQKKMEEGLITVDKRIDNIHVSHAEVRSNQACYNKSLDYLVKRFDRLEKKLDKIIDKKQ